VVATHEGEAGVRRAAREEEELPDPLGLHWGGSAGGAGWNWGGAGVRTPSAVAAGGRFLWGIGTEWLKNKGNCVYTLSQNSIIILYLIF
jgi:hypothetical protein